MIKLNLNTVINAFFAQFSTQMLKGKVTYKVLPNGKVVVQIPYYGVQALTESKINALGVAITRLFNSSTPHTTVELRLVQLQYPYLDSSILAQYVAINAGKYNFLRMQKMTFKALRGAQLSGVKLELAGRLTTQRSIPRKTVENGHTGSFTVNKQLNSKLDFSQYASINKLGAFTIKV
jgi:ribosomal protein S3